MTCQAQQAVHADLTEAVRKERLARDLQLDLQTQADNLLDQYVVLCASRVPEQAAVIQDETAEGVAIKEQLKTLRDKSEEAAILAQELCKFRTDLQVLCR